MPRDASGNYILPAGNPVVTNTDITTDWGNGTMSDVGATLTDSLSRTGNGGMLVPLLFNDGSISTPGFGFNAEPSLGLMRSAAGELVGVVASANQWRMTAANQLEVYRGGVWVRVADESGVSGTYLRLLGGTLTGDLTIGDGVSGDTLNIQADIGAIKFKRDDATNQAQIYTFNDEIYLVLLNNFGTVPLTTIRLRTDGTAVLTTGTSAPVAGDELTVKSYVDAGDAVNQSEINANGVNINTNLSSINAHTILINDNATDIATNTAGLAALQPPFRFPVPLQIYSSNSSSWETVDIQTAVTDAFNVRYITARYVHTYVKTPATVDLIVSRVYAVEDGQSESTSAGNRILEYTAYRTSSGDIIDGLTGEFTIGVVGGKFRILNNYTSGAGIAGNVIIYIVGYQR